MRILNKDLSAFIVGGDARAPELPHRAHAINLPDNKPIAKQQIHRKSS
ncbi:hypothetical protein [Pseudoalteromonas luteoviolacea]|uniref:Uncharacterized protein n=1 Tax=Pseudoalteromonas luteoviolacea S4054 TaxID=1129367 RepID=A0A0F6A659_9GAMM|nr:hypothetical protein [Pseudoalteromonas luteoviolacea]KKE81311.1 hypothetical protein N479_22510 [Pseudoalteromonas luteoviolacea S4054]KZN70680.1 hypothetical protein N481_20925 [Pseudoalteromonas luteoviolacea S4047-1]